MIRYLYTLIYPEEPTEPIEDRQSSPKPIASVDHISFEQVIDDVAAPTHDPGLVASDDADITIDAAVLDRDENHGVTTQDSLQTQNESVIDQSAATFDISLSLLDQDLQVYVLGGFELSLHRKSYKKSRLQKCSRSYISCVTYCKSTSFQKKL